MSDRLDAHEGQSLHRNRAMRRVLPSDQYLSAKSSKLKKRVDFFALIFVLAPFLFVLWIETHPKDFPDGKFPPLAVATLVSMAAAFFSVIWLCFRHAE